MEVEWTYFFYKVRAKELKIFNILRAYSCSKWGEKREKIEWAINISVDFKKSLSHILLYQPYWTVFMCTTMFAQYIADSLLPNFHLFIPSLLFTPLLVLFSHFLFSATPFCYFLFSLSVCATHCSNKRRRRIAPKSKHLFNAHSETLFPTAANKLYTRQKAIYFGWHSKASFHDEKPNPTFEVLQVILCYHIRRAFMKQYLKKSL